MKRLLATELDPNLTCRRPSVFPAARPSLLQALGHVVQFAVAGVVEGRAPVVVADVDVGAGPPAASPRYRPPQPDFAA
jgi:hypothetical protein